MSRKKVLFHWACKWDQLSPESIIFWVLEFCNRYPYLCLLMLNWMLRSWRHTAAHKSHLMLLNCCSLSLNSSTSLKNTIQSEVEYSSLYDHKYTFLKISLIKINGSSFQPNAFRKGEGEVDLCVVQFIKPPYWWLAIASVCYTAAFFSVLFVIVSGPKTDFNNSIKFD